MKIKDILVWINFFGVINAINCSKLNSNFNQVSMYNSMKCKNTLFEHNVEAANACTSICLGRTDCVGVFYSRSTKLCTGCGHLNQDNLEPTTADTKYFYNCAEAVSWANYDGSYYKVFTENTPFEEAKRYCRHYCSYLVHIDSSEEDEFVNNLAQTASVPNYYIGLEYDTTDSKWKWDDDNKEPTFTAWYPTEPKGVPTERCVIAYGHATNTWTDYQCSLSFPFVCEKRPTFT